MSDKLRSARAWLAGCIEAGYVDEANHPGHEEEWAHLCELATDRTCATCRWGVASNSVADSLQCFRVSAEGSLASVVVDTYDARADFFVAPTFGCVQWEGK